MNAASIVKKEGSGWRGRLRQSLDNERVFGPLLVTPAVLLIVLLVAYPFIRALLLSMTDLRVAQAATGNFIGLENYIGLWNRSVFRNIVFVNTLIYVLGAVPIKVLLGLILAVTLNRDSIPFVNFFRGVVLLPWVIPASLSILVWAWMFEPTFSILNEVLEAIRFPGADHVGGRAGLGAGRDRLLILDARLRQWHDGRGCERIARSANSPLHCRQMTPRRHQMHRARHLAASNCAN